MPSAKPLVWGVMVWAGLATSLRADIISGGDWRFFGASVDGQAVNVSGDFSLSDLNPSSTSQASTAPTPASNPAPVAIEPPPPPVLPATPPPPPPPGTVFNARIEFGPGPYPDQGGLTTGNAQAWYNSPEISSFFGGQPNAQQQADFANAVLQRVEHTFALAGVNVSLTADPSVPASHTLSLVSNTSSSLDSGDIGLTYVGANGFNFIDPSAKAVHSLDQLEWLVAHNVSHELMLAFGVGENYDQSGNFIDAKLANMNMMLNPNATFSSAAAQALHASNFALNDDPNKTPGQQLVSAQPVPEPATVLLWAAGLTLAAGSLRRRARDGR